VSATTNTAAAQVQGDTIHSFVSLRSKFSNIEKWKGELESGKNIVLG
jgi:hypothetical protein